MLVFSLLVLGLIVSGLYQSHCNRVDRMQRVEQMRVYHTLSACVKSTITL